ncbi:MAG: DUF3352 domain-containing protein [Candidatus Omnitrophica bacterium]|nr:DUF3352 domain-containing protein [Candidatus Omnitrophota bacterium]
MKKFLIFIAILAVLAGAGVFFLQKQAGITIFKTEEFKIESVLPEKPVAYFEFRNTRANVERLATTPFWKALGEVNWELLMEGNKKNAQALIIFKLMQEGLEDPKKAEVLSKFLGQDIGMAVYPFEIDIDALGAGDPRVFEDILQRIGQSFYFVTRLDAQAQVAELIARSQDQLGENVTVEDVIYKDQPIKVIKLEGAKIEVAYTRINDLLIVALDKFAIQRSIDVHQDAAPGLITDAEYLRTKDAFIDETDMKAYLNTHYVMQTAMDGMKQLFVKQGGDEALIHEQVEQTFKSISGFKSVGISSLWKDTLNTKVDFHFVLDEMQASVAEYYRSCTNVSNASIKLVPQQALAYQWSNCFDLNYYWEEMKAEFERTAQPGQPSPAEQIAQYEKLIGLTIEGDILPAFGKEIGGYLNTVHLDRKFPIPELLLFLKINDRQKAEKLIGLVHNQPIAVFQSEEYKGVSLNYISLPIADYVSPGYAFINDYLTIALNKEMLKSSVDVSSGAAGGITGNASFQAVNQGLTADSIGVMYLEVDELAFKVSSILEWSNEWATANDQKKEAFKTGAELRLTQVQKNIEEDEQILNAAVAERKEMESRVQAVRESGQDLGMLEKSLAKLQEREDEIRGDIEASIDEALEIQETIKGYSKRAMPADERAKYLDGIIYPLIDCFKTVEGFSTVTTMSEGAMETRIFTKL